MSSLITISLHNKKHLSCGCYKVGFLSSLISRLSHTGSDFFRDSIFGHNAGKVTGYDVPARQTAIGMILFFKFLICAWQSSIMTSQSSTRNTVTSASFPTESEPTVSSKPKALAGVMVTERIMSTNGIPKSYTNRITK